MFPNVLNEPPQQFKVGLPADFGMGVDERFKESMGVWIIRTADDYVQHASGFYVLISTCTVLTLPGMRSPVGTLTSLMSP